MCGISEIAQLRNIMGKYFLLEHNDGEWVIFYNSIWSLTQHGQFVVSCFARCSVDPMQFSTHGLPTNQTPKIGKAQPKCPRGTGHYFATPSLNKNADKADLIYLIVSRKKN